MGSKPSWKLNDTFPDLIGEAYWDGPVDTDDIASAEMIELTGVGANAATNQSSVSDITIDAEI